VQRRENLLAAYRNDDGERFLLSAACTHAGCVVSGNGFERRWDCPCHGSQFAPDGSVLQEPAASPLSEAEDEASAPPPDAKRSDARPSA
jgi:Rieske Fe-S protein